MTGTSPKEKTELKKVPLLESYPLEDSCLRMDCIATYYNLEKNMIINVKEQRIEYGLRLLTDLERSWKTLIIR